MATAMHWSRSARPPGHARDEEFERLLRREHWTLQACTEALREGVAAEMSAVKDLLDQSKEVAEQSVGLAMLELSSRMVQGIETALRRLRDGVYGSCADCGDRISSARRRALPGAVLCRDCQEQHDAAALMLGPATVGWEATFAPAP